MTTPEAASPRIDWQTFYEAIPEFATGNASIAHAITKSGLEKDLIEMIKLRVSQINSCAFCVQYHLNEARKLGVAPEKLDLIAAWREAGVFSAREAAALEWTERITLQAAAHIGDDAFARVSAHFSQRELVFLTTAIGQINFWNRIAAPFRFAPPVPRSA
jgi:AhpD family alkylhydroperoxidase